MGGPRLILASASRARAALLTAAGLRFAVAVAPEAAEDGAIAAARAAGASPEELVLAAARAKAQAVAGNPVGGDCEAVILAADTVVVAADGGIVGKGRDDAESAAILRRLSGSRHRVLTGAVILARPSGLRRELVASTTVEMAQMSEAEVAAYVASGSASGAAGAYRIQEGGTDRFVRMIEGSFSNVVGLPVEEIIRELAAMGVHPAGGTETATEERPR